MSQTPTYYEILQITPQASDPEVKDAYRRLAFENHPDRNPFNRSVAELRFRLINEAYSHLKTREKRLRYNQVLRRAMMQKPAALPPQNDNSAAVKGNWLAQLAAFLIGSKNQSTGH